MADRLRFEIFHKDILVYDAATHQAIGFFVPPEDREWIHIDYKPEQVENIAEFPNLISIPCFGIYPLNLDPQWEALGFSLHEALNWLRDGKLRNPETVKAWQDCGFDRPEAIHPWLHYLIRPAPELAKTLRDLGVQPTDLSLWLRLAKVPAADIAPWIRAGFDVREVKAWKTVNFLPEEARTWRDREVTPRDAAIRRQLNLSETDRQRWLDRGFDAPSAVDWIGIGITDPQEAWEWLGSNLKINDVHLWRNAGYTAIEALEHRQRDIYEPPPRS